MFPVIVSIGDFPIHTYGVLLALGFAAALFTAIALGKEAGIGSDDIGDICLVALITGLVGGRLLFVAVEWDQFAGDLPSILLRRDGFVFFGGLLLAIPSTILFVKRRGLALPVVADMMAPAVALGHSIGRLGCFAQGCCHGGPCEWGVTFPPDSPASIAFGGIPVHPTQIYESLVLLLLFGSLLKFRGSKPFAGAVFLVYLASYAVIRFGIELLRADDRGFYAVGLSVSQWISIAVFLATLIAYRRLKPSPSSP
jgi:phosphatidylglycerol:prolipoprotein diacylglycerol transferase